MKVAIVQEWIVSTGGSDKVASEFLKLFPGSDLYTLVYEQAALDQLKIEAANIYTSQLQTPSFIRKRFRNFLPLFPFLIEQFDLSRYDLIISSSHAVAKGVITGPNQLHVCYCHSPIRYAWDKYFEYMQDHRLFGLRGLIVKYSLHRIRLWDYASSARVDHFIANSHFVSKRIWKYYKRKSTVIHPPIDIESCSYSEDKSDYYITASRLVAYKKIDVIIRAFGEMPSKRLMVVGEGPQFKQLKSLCSENVEMSGYLNDKDLKIRLSKAKAFIFASEEDFGMLPVEAQACGTPVIAFRGGGAVESIIEGETGVFFDEQKPASIIGALQRFEDLKFEQKKLRANAERFSVQVFRDKIMSVVLNKYKSFKHFPNG